ncbi:DUF4179 domain-containing protein [Cytobacillus massiliigabonensis]|uniref:DUF4179 domain-containing protein n=1 Tax=Cytobacillus massiliigabonensis TaxID=1871011 RepID=UPI001F25B0FB|nr:DUF4179 domain-containing protein [Cytobacillus massiliigabonensis]
MGGYMNGDKKLQSSELFEEIAFNREDQLQVYARLKGKSDRRSVIGKKKKVFIPAVIVLMIVGAAIYMPSNPVLALAKLPFFESIFQFLGDGGLKGAATEDKQDIQQQQSEDGISMEIQEAVYDGIRLSISYRIKSEEPIKEFNRRKINAHIPFNGFQMDKVISNDQFKQVSDHEVIGYSTFTYTASEMPDDIKVDFLYRGAIDYHSTKKKGFRFLFDIPIKKTSEIDTIVLNKKQSHNGEELTLKEINVSPISTTVKLQYKVPYKNDIYVYSPSIQLLDQNGKMFKELPLTGNNWVPKQIKQGDQWYTVYDASLLYEQLDEDTKEITMRLVKNKDLSKYMKQKFISLAQAKNQYLDFGDMGTIKITNIDQKEDSTVIEYEYKSSFAFHYNLSPLFLKDVESKGYSGIEVERKYLGNETYLVEELFIGLPKEELFVSYVKGKAPELVEELEINVSTDDMK